jgi:hypothetical protein
MNKVVAIFLLLGLAAGLVAWTLLGSRTVPQVVDTAGQEEPQADALYVNGWNVGNYGEALVKDTYVRYHDLLGEPLSTFDGQCQSFRLGRLCYTPNTTLA